MATPPAAMPFPFNTFLRTPLCIDKPLSIRYTYIFNDPIPPRPSGFHPTHHLAQAVRMHATIYVFIYISSSHSLRIAPPHAACDLRKRITSKTQEKNTNQKQHPSPLSVVSLAPVTRRTVLVIRRLVAPHGAGVAADVACAREWRVASGLKVSSGVVRANERTHRRRRGCHQHLFHVGTYRRRPGAGGGCHRAPPPPPPPARPRARGGARPYCRGGRTLACVDMGVSVVVEGDKGVE